jgi:hypothetical protein
MNPPPPAKKSASSPHTEKSTAEATSAVPSADVIEPRNPSQGSRSITIATTVATGGKPVQYVLTDGTFVLTTDNERVVADTIRNRLHGAA